MSLALGGIFPTGCLEPGLIVVRFRRTLTLTLTKPIAVSRPLPFTIFTARQNQSGQLVWFVWFTSRCFGGILWI